MIDALTVLHTTAQDSTTDQSSSDVPVAAAQWSDETTEALESKINAVIASCVQGSSEALQVLVPLVLSTMNTAVSKLQSQIDPPADGDVDVSIQPATATPFSASDMAPVPSSPSAPDLSTAVWCTAALTAINKLSDPVVLGERIKTLAKRTPYGIRSGVALAFENTDLFSLWRWEILRSVSILSYPIKFHVIICSTPFHSVSPYPVLFLSVSSYSILFSLLFSCPYRLVLSYYFFLLDKKRFHHYLYPEKSLYSSFCHYKMP